MLDWDYNSKTIIVKYGITMQVEHVKSGRCMAALWLQVYLTPL